VDHRIFSKIRQHHERVTATKIDNYRNINSKSDVF